MRPWWAQRGHLRRRTGGRRQEHQRLRGRYWHWRVVLVHCVVIRFEQLGLESEDKSLIKMTKNPECQLFGYIMVIKLARLSLKSEGRQKLSTIFQQQQQRRNSPRVIILPWGNCREPRGWQFSFCPRRSVFRMWEIRCLETEVALKFTRRRRRRKIKVKSSKMIFEWGAPRWKMSLLEILRGLLPPSKAANAALQRRPSRRSAAGLDDD